MQKDTVVLDFDLPHNNDLHYWNFNIADFDITGVTHLKSHHYVNHIAANNKLKHIHSFTFEKGCRFITHVLQNTLFSDV